MAPGIHRVLFVFFFVSGFCGLLYETVWLRLAFASFGIITPVLSVVLAVFMLGLAVGSWLAGRLVSGLAERFGVSAILLYAGAETFLGIGGLAVPSLFELARGWLLPLGQMDSGPYLAWSALALALSILPFCIAMGTTYPLILHFIREHAAEEERGFSFLYIANLAGAMCGCFLTAAVLIELLGFRGALHLAAGLNFALAAGSVVLARTMGGVGASGGADEADSEEDRSGEAPEPEEGGGSVGGDVDGKEPEKGPGRGVGEADVGFALSLVILFVGGFTSMALEVIWTRVFTPVLQTLVYSFAALLTVYLWASAIGSWAYRFHLEKGRALSVPRLVGLAGIAAFLPILVSDPRVTGHYLVLLLSITPLCGILGYLTPQLIDRVSRGNPRTAGIAYAVNVLGSVLGPLASCYLVLPTLGARQGMVLLCMPYLLLVLALWKAPSFGGAWRTGSLLGGAVAAAVCLGVSLSYEETLIFEGIEIEASQIRRDHTATVINGGEGMGRQIWVNGISMTVLTPITKMMSHFPLALHPDPESIGIICFGMGVTYRSALTWDVPTTAVELVPSVRDTFPDFFPEGEELLRHPKGEVVIDDGRRYLLRTDKRFDVLTIDPPPPVEAAGSSLLYSTDFYELVKQRLAPGGILLHWCPVSTGPILAAVTRSLKEGFPHVRAFRSIEGWGVHYVATREPFEFPAPEVMMERMPAAAREDLAEWDTGHADAAAVYADLLAREVTLESLMLDDPSIRITDDRPFNEYFLLRRVFHIQGEP